MSDLSDPILILLIGSISGLLALCCKLGYASKCKRVKMCCLEIDRDTEHEAIVSISPISQNLSNRNLTGNNTMV